MNTATAQKPKILVVDDTPLNIGVLFDLLDNHQYEVFIAQNGESALQISQIEKPNLILMDVMMPGLDGFETCKRLKNQESTRDIPLIFITALTDIRDKVYGFNIGAVDYITKPFQREEVLVRIRTHLMLQDLQARLREQNEILQQEIKERKRVESELQTANTLLKELVNLDGLTLIANRRRFDEYLQQTWAEMREKQQYLSVLLCDIDYFKKYNDTYGHLQGDDCLKQIAQAIKHNTPSPLGLAARYGGEEFAVILPNYLPAKAIRVANNIQQAIHQLNLYHCGSPLLHVTLSIGVTGSIPNPHLTIKALLQTADNALYKAKEAGKNQIFNLECEENDESVVNK